jgi:hypothetical protein
VGADGLRQRTLVQGGSICSLQSCGEDGSKLVKKLSDRPCGFFFSRETEALHTEERNIVNRYH